MNNFEKMLNTPKNTSLENKEVNPYLDNENKEIRNEVLTKTFYHGTCLRKGENSLSKESLDPLYRQKRNGEETRNVTGSSKEGTGIYFSPYKTLKDRMESDKLGIEYGEKWMDDNDANTVRGVLYEMKLSSYAKILLEKDNLWKELNIQIENLDKEQFEKLRGKGIDGLFDTQNQEFLLLNQETLERFSESQSWERENIVYPLYRGKPLVEEAIHISDEESLNTFLINELGEDFILKKNEDSYVAISKIEKNEKVYRIHKDQKSEIKQISETYD